MVPLVFLYFIISIKHPTISTFDYFGCFSLFSSYFGAVNKGGRKGIEQ